MTCKILLVDDSRDLLDAYVAVLQASTPHEVRTASSGRAALEVVRAWRPDVLVTDVLMPDLNGLELITLLRSELPPPLPTIVVWSGFPDFEAEALRRGARVFQPKPIYPDDLVVLIESLLGERQPPEHLRSGAQARRRAASELAAAQMSATLARRPHFQRVAELNTRLISRYFGGADVGLLVMDGGQMRVFAASSPRWGIGTRPEGILGHALDVVESGSTLIVPDPAVMQGSTVMPPAHEAQLLVAVPLRAAEGMAIGALALADGRPIPFDAHDLAILEHIGDRHADVFAGAETADRPHEPGVVSGPTWRYALRCELEHVRPGQALVIALAPLPVRDGPTIPVASPGELRVVSQMLEALLERLPPRTALGRLGSATVAAYTVGDPGVGETTLPPLLQSLTGEPETMRLGMLTVRNLHPTDGGAAFLEIAHWLLASARARGPGAVVRAHLGPELDPGRLAA